MDDFNQTELKNPPGARAIAFHILQEWEKAGGVLSEIISKHIRGEINDLDKSLIWELVSGVVRHKTRLDFIYECYLKRPGSLKNNRAAILLRMGIYQLALDSSIPSYAAINESVQIAKDELPEYMAKLINAVLRSYQRQPEKSKFPDRAENPAEYLSKYYSFPLWLAERWLGQHGFDETAALMESLNNRPAASFKIINSRCSRPDIITSLQKSGIDVTPSDLFDDFILADSYQPVLKSEDFQKGLLMVQDQSQALPVYLLDPPVGTTVLDLCSAPGGKTIAIADRVGQKGKVVSIDSNPERLKLLEQNVMRVGFENIEIICADILKSETERKFHYIMLDVPCSALGTINHNPDLKWTRTLNDIQRQAKSQLQLLNKAVSFLEIGGKLIYSTCSMEREEIERVVSDFLAANRNFVPENMNNEITARYNTETGIYRTWPHKHKIGGGGFAIIRRTE